MFARIAGLCESEEKVAVATVVRTYGSTPREVGARMVVLADGSFAGTVGGGCGEAEVWQQARRVLRHGRATMVCVDLTEDADSPLRANGQPADAAGNAVCGGRMDVFVDLWQRGDMAEAAHIVDLMDGNCGVSLVTVLDAPANGPCRAGTHLLVDEHGVPRGTLGTPDLDHRMVEATRRAFASRRAVTAALPLSPQEPLLLPAPKVTPQGSLVLFVDVLERPPVLVIVGAGHCALPLSRFARMLGFCIVILDDRPECATAERFPDAHRILVGDLEEQAAHLDLGPNTYVVLVTRGHRLDEAILRRIVRAPLGYVGMIGSRRRVGVVLGTMERDGYPRDLLERVYSPIGLDIGAHTPEEIAISILGEIIMVRHGGSGRPLSQKQPQLRSSRAHADTVDPGSHG